MKKIIFSFFCLVSLAISCSKNDNPSTPVASAVKYMTTTQGSAWNYESIDNVAVSTSLYLITSTSRDSTVNGRLYHVYTNSSNNASEYYNIAGGDYYSYQNLPASVGGSKAENLYLKENVDVNTSWNQSYNITVSGVPVTVTLTNKITEKGINRTVNGIAYSNVIHVQTSLAAAGVPSSSLTSDIQSYYAPKVGLIENTTKINLNYLGVVSNTDTQIKLKTSTIL